MTKKLNQTGAVSIMSVVIFITIITVVVVAYLVSSLAQQRTAVNFDMSTRAYYSAESGVQDAVRGVTPALIAGRDSCKPALPAGSDGRLGASGIDYGLDYTCQLINPTPAEITGEIEPGGRTAMIRIDPVSIGSGPYRLSIKWSEKTEPGEDALIPRDDGSKNQSLKNINKWSSSAGAWHPMLKLNLINHPLNGSFTRDLIKQRVAFLNPVEVDSSLTFDKSNSLPQDNTLSGARCEASYDISTEFSCSKTINLIGYNFGTDAIYLRIGTLYRSTTFSLLLIDNNDISMQLKNTQVVVDVTGRAKNVYRRVKQAFPLANYVEDSQSDAAVVAGEGICKNFALTTIPAEFNGQCDPLN